VPAHIFVLDETNYKICTTRGIVGLPKGNTPKTQHELLSRMAIIKDKDHVLFYVTEAKELRGVWKAVGEPFYEETTVWEDDTYPIRFRIDCTEYNFANSLRLNDIYDLRNSGKLWAWSLRRNNNATNAAFSIPNSEYDILFQEYLKINPFEINKAVIMKPYNVVEPNLYGQLAMQSGGKKPYEASLVSLLFRALVNGEFKDIFGNYTDYISYVPTNLGTEMDVLLFFTNPKLIHQIMSYEIIEVKADRFDSKALRQLIGYESWFIHNKVHGDMNMVRVSAVAKRYDMDVINYVKNRKIFEGKEIKLFTYDVSDNGKLMLNNVNSEKEQ